MSPSFKPRRNPEPPATGRPGAPQLDLLFPAVAAPERAAIRPSWTVRELVAEIRNHVEREYRDVRVEGEISNLRQAASGHVYFTLKDDQGQIPVVMFRGKARLLKFSLKDGLAVQVRGGVSVYEDRGQLQLVAESMDPRGVGSLQIAFEQLYAKLRDEGLFDAERKRSLPAYPRVIGVISSPQGAVIHDILNVLARRHARVQVLLYPVAVQGEAAAGELIAALNWFAKNPCADVLLLARGGGSLEDLAAFNSEAVARAISAASIPVVSAVGHETDFTIADFVADLRAPTPSAAAELITDAQYRVQEHLAALEARLERAARYQRMQARERLARLDASAVFARMRHGLFRRQQRVDELRFRLESFWNRVAAGSSQQLHRLQARLMQQDPRRQLGLHQERLRALRKTLCQANSVAIERRNARWSRARARLIALSPLAVLERGYALVYRGPQGVKPADLVKDASSLQAGDGVRIRFAHGSAHARVVETEKGRQEES